MKTRMSTVEKQRLWETWTRKTIYADRGVYNIAPRHLVIRNFVQNGLIPFVRRKGYFFQGNVSSITNSLLRYLFALYVGDTVKFKTPHCNVYEEHFEEFEHRFDFTEMEPFWEQWECIEDFETGNFGEKAKYTLTYFIWASLDLRGSPAYKKLEAIFKEIEESEMTPAERKEAKGKEDPYLHDSSKINYEDRHWH
jgi:hypothetical protein